MRNQNLKRYYSFIIFQKKYNLFEEEKTAANHSKHFTPLANKKKSLEKIQKSLKNPKN